MSTSAYTAEELQEAVQLYKEARIPLFTCLTSLTWILYEYFDTLADEVMFIWPGELSVVKTLFFIIRYYTIVLALFDVAQIHSFAHFNPSLQTCVAMDAMIRVAGAISLWTVEIIMQLRIYALYRGSKRVAACNAFLFLMSIGGFIWILVHNALGLAAVIKTAKELPIPGCPVVHTAIEWAQWVPATAFEGILFCALGKIAWTAFARRRERRNGQGLIYILLHDNVLYFFGVTALLVFNNLMVVGATRIPWFSYGPFHVAIGIMTCRLLMHLHKAVVLSRISVSQGSVELGKIRSRDSRTVSMLNAKLGSHPDDSLSKQATMDWIARSGSETDTFVSDRSGATTMDEETKTSKRGKCLLLSQRRGVPGEIGSSKQSRLGSLDGHSTPYSRQVPDLR